MISANRINGIDAVLSDGMNREKMAKNENLNLARLPIPPRGHPDFSSTFQLDIDVALGLGHASRRHAKQSASRRAIVNNDQHRAARYGKARSKRKHPIPRGNRRLRQFFGDFGCPTWIRTMNNASKGRCVTVTPSDKPSEN